MFPFRTALLRHADNLSQANAAEVRVRSEPLRYNGEKQIPACDRQASYRPDSMHRDGFGMAWWKAERLRGMREPCNRLGSNGIEKRCANGNRMPGLRGTDGASELSHALLCSGQASDPPTPRPAQTGRLWRGKQVASDYGGRIHRAGEARDRKFQMIRLIVAAEATTHKAEQRKRIPTSSSRREGSIT